MIDPQTITNENVFSLDYSGEERRAFLAKLQCEPDEPEPCERRKSNPLIAAFRYVIHRFKKISAGMALQVNGVHGKDREGA
ncbi:hypothetical protein ACFQUU_25190 [Herbaspirillum sp. GCM10030257]|uniref:hypothetical protein n=1 Tax=Herbaspirillum sp. GCM10030257 TaxID=3273393 RepID=UPI003613A036